MAYHGGAFAKIISDFFFRDVAKFGNAADELCFQSIKLCLNCFDSVFRARIRTFGFGVRRNDFITFSAAFVRLFLYRYGGYHTNAAEQSRRMHDNLICSRG